MKLKHLTDDCLISETRRYVVQERELLTTILHHFREMERRRLFCKHGSMHACAVKEFGYSDDQAFRRVTAMRLINELPEIEQKIEAGQINLSHVGVAHSLFKHEKKLGQPLTTDQKLEVFEAIAGQSIRQAQAIAQSFASEKMRHKDFVKPLGDGRNLFTGELTNEVLEKLEKLRGLFAHKNPDATFNDLMDQALDHALEQLKPAKPSSRKTQPESKAEIRRQIWLRDGNACTCCGSTFAVQEDHIIPESMGGEYTLENMRLLCRACNQRAAIETLGQRKMEPFLRNTATSRQTFNTPRPATSRK